MSSAKVVREGTEEGALDTAEEEEKGVTSYGSVDGLEGNAASAAARFSAAAL